MLVAFVCLYLVGTLAIGWWASRRVHSATDFVLAGRHLPLGMAACATFATWFGTETVMGASGEFVKHGVRGIIEDPFGAALCLLLVGLFFARPLYRMNLLTFCDYFRIRFGKGAELVGALCIVPSYFGWVAAQFVALGIVMHKLVPAISPFAGVWISAVLVIGYTCVGGMWAVSVTDSVQTIVIIIGLTILAVVSVNAAGGLGAVIEAQPTGFFDFLPKAKPMEVVLYLSAWMTVGLGSIPQQDVFQRVMSAKSERTAVRSAIVASGMYLSIAFLPLLIALCAKKLHPELAAGDVQQLIPEMVLQHGGLPIQILFFGALLSAILSTASGAVLAPASVVGENIVKPLRGGDIPDAALLRILRMSVVGVALVSAVMAGMRGNIYELVGESSALSLVSLFVPLVGGLSWKRATQAGALAAMLGGMGVWLVCLNMHTVFPAMLFGLGASILGMLFGSLLSPRHKPTPLA